MGIFKKIFFVLIITTLFGCPREEENCNDFGSTVRVDDMITLTPLQVIYNQGDEIEMKLEIPAVNTYYGNELNLFQLTNDYFATLSISQNRLTTGNQLTFIKGSLGTTLSTFELPYNFDTQKYELDVKIKLNAVGVYSLYTNETILINGITKCNRYFMHTKIQGSVNNMVEFTVQ
jgi:hypothetical protein